MPSPADQPGWLPDPEQPGMLRWWNGLGWSDARRRADAAMERIRSDIEGATRGSTITPQQVARTTADRSLIRPAQVAAGTAVRAANPAAAGAVTLGVLALLFSVYGVLPLVGLIVSLTGLVRSRRLAQQGVQRTGLARSLIGLVLSTIGLLGSLSSLVKLITDLMQAAANT